MQKYTHHMEFDATLKISIWGLRKVYYFYYTVDYFPDKHIFMYELHLRMLVQVPIYSKVNEMS